MSACVSEREEHRMSEEQRCGEKTGASVDTEQSIASQGKARSMEDG